jgi:hypothetical protein
MLFLVIQDHEPGLCPLRDGLGPDALYQHTDGVEVRYAVADVPGHRLTFLLETDSYEALQEFFEPGRTRCTTNISPVLDLG